MNLKLTVNIVTALTFVAAVALAITFGWPDGQLHPNVGGLVVDWGNPPQKTLICSGTLIASDVFLTAAHCIAVLPTFPAEPEPRVWVTFDTQFTESSVLLAGTAHVNPGYKAPPVAEPGDVAIVKLDAPASGIPVAQLPQLGYFENLAASKQLKDAVFTAVGYGILRESKKKGPLSLPSVPYPMSGDTRYYAYSSFNGITPAWLFLSQNPSTNDGGTCFGDSGGPNFYAATNIIAALTVWGDRFCRAANVVYRLDTPAAREFLSQWVTVP
jgi:secreted trypsin-like serine protease